jgi:hypothetical protein
MQAWYEKCYVNQSREPTTLFASVKLASWKMKARIVSKVRENNCFEDFGHARSY